MDSNSILFFITGLLYFGIAFIFIKSTDGNLRKAMIYAFLSVAYNFLTRSFCFLLNHEFYDNNLFWINLLIILPSLISGAFGFFYLYYRFYRIDKNINNYTNKRKK